jgi:hypothetical protein
MIRWRWAAGAAVTLAVVAACAEIGTGPSVPAAIELSPFPFPSVVVGDTLRSFDGKVAPIRAIVRNSAGDAIDDAPVRYLYADFNRDSALVVDSLTGVVVARKAITSEARLAARVGSTLQVIRTLTVTQRPDTASVPAAPAIFRVTVPDTGRTGAQSNTSPALSVTVQSRATGQPSGVAGWAVRFDLVRPANPTNDTSATVYLVDDRGSASIIDTTDGSGNAGRKVRIRAATYPGVAGDTVDVRATILYRGAPVPGAPLRLRLPVRR